MSFGKRITTAAATFLMVLTVGILSACVDGQTSQISSAADEDAIRRMATQYTQAVEKADLEKFLSFYADSIVVMPPGQPVMRGRQAAKAFAEPLFDQFVMQESISYDELHVDGDWAAGRFSYTFSVTPKTGGATTTERGKAMVWLKRTASGVWQFSHWIWNQDRPPA